MSLQETEQKIQSFFDAVPDGIFQSTPNGKLLTVNPALIQMLGYSSEEELLAVDIRELYADPAERDRLMSILQQEGELRNVELLLKRKDGSHVVVLENSRAVKNEAGEVLHHQGILTDISERKHADEALRESEQRQRVVLEQIPGVLWCTDRNLIITCSLGAGLATLQLAANQLVGLHLFDAIGSHDPEYRPVKAHIQALNGESSTYVETWHDHVYRVHVEPLRDRDGKINGTLGLAIDVTEHLQTEEALRESAERYMLAALGANDGLWDWNLKTNEIYLSARWKSMLGYTDLEIQNRLEEWFNRVHPDDVMRVQSEINAHLKGLTPHFQNEHRMLHKDGTYRWILSRGLAVRDSHGIAYRMAGSQTDVTDRRLAEERLLHEAIHDALTGLANRALFMDLLRRSLGRSRRRDDYLFAVLFLDLDRFKVINDSLGHMLGDQLLIAIGRRLESCVRGGDTVARLGGDEFTILLDDIDGETDAITIAGRIQLELSRPFRIAEHEVYTSASIGIALSTERYERPEELLRDADIAMYRAKALGKARHQVFDSEMHARAVALLKLETDLRRAYERKEFLLYYQPTVSLSTGKINGFEALIRWVHPERGIILPAEFIPIAEETGLILPIGRWVLQQACLQMKKWHKALRKDLTMSVNLSGKQLVQADLVQEVQEAIKTTGFESENLIVEITESMLIENPDVAAENLKNLKGLKVQVHIDDFGTGYSSLSYLHRFPIDTLKIDRSFVSRIGADIENMEIIRTIITLAHSLGMDVIAEGIETAHQVDELLLLQCNWGQGFHFSRPVDAEGVEALLMNTKARSDNNG